MTMYYTFLDVGKLSHSILITDFIVHYAQLV